MDQPERGARPHRLRRSTPGHRMLLCTALACALLSLGAPPAWADEPAPSATGQEQPASAALGLPQMGGPLTANPNPAKFDAGPGGKVFVTGAITGLAQWQSNAAPGDCAGQADISNGQVFIQKNDGLFRFFVQA